MSSAPPLRPHSSRSRRAGLVALRQVASDTGAAVLFVEQHVRMALEVADRAVVLAHGETVLEGAAAALARDPEMFERAYLGETHVASA